MANLFTMDLQLFASTKIADVIVPEVFNSYIVERTPELSALFSSGIISNDPQLDALASGGGTILNMPFFTDLTGDDEVLSDSVALTPGKITGTKDQARLQLRGRAWGVNDLSKALSGDDPMRQIGELVSAYWARRYQAMLISTLSGVFASASMAGNIHDITANTGLEAFTGEEFINASHKLGDAESKLTAVMVHSMTFADMKKKNLIEYIPDSQGVVNIPTYLGKRVIVDDGCPVDGANYTTYIFGQGAIGFGQGSAPVPTETDRDSLLGEEYLINRNHFILHPRGVKWNEATVAGEAPSNAELALAGNWTRVYDLKNVRIVKFVHQLG